MPSPRLITRLLAVVFAIGAIAIPALPASAASCGDVSVSTYAALVSAARPASCPAGDVMTITVTANVTGNGSEIDWYDSGTLVIKGPDGAVGAARPTITFTATTGITGDGRWWSGDLPGSITLRNLILTGVNDPTGNRSVVQSRDRQGVRGNAVITLDNTAIVNTTTAEPTIVNSTSSGAAGGSVVLTNGSSITGNTITNEQYSAGSAVYASGAVTVDSSTIANNINQTSGGSPGSGGVWAQSGDISITNSTIAGNQALNGDGGGAYAASGDITISGSTISGNSAAGSGGGVYAAAGLTVTNSTIADNTSAGSGAGGIRGGTSTTIRYSTIAGNTNSGSGPQTIGQSGGTLALIASAITAASGTVCAVSGATRTGNYSIASASGCLPASLGTNQVNTNTEIALGSLASNGGTTLTMLPGATSVLRSFINAANPAPSVTTDQRGVTRTSPFTVGAVAVASTNADLAALTLSSGTLSPSFAAATTSYTANVANTSASLTVTPTAAQNGATITVNGSAVASGTASGTVSLSVGPNTVTTVVTAPDGTTTRTYTVTVTRAPSADADLAGLVVTAGGTTAPLSPTFAAATTAYATAVANATLSAAITPTASETNATIRVNGTTVASGSASGAISLAVGTNTVTTVVTAQDGTTTKSYSVVITRAPSSDATLSNLVLTQGGTSVALTPAFAPTATDFTASVANAVADVAATPTTTDAGATVAVNGTNVVSGSASSAIPLSVGRTAISVVVTAQDGTTTRSYAIAVTRAAAPTPSVAAPTITGLTPGDDRMTVSWADPTATNGTIYTAAASPGGRSCTAQAPATRCTITGLENGRAYTFAITATTSDGASSTSPPSAMSRPAPRAAGALRVLRTFVRGATIVVRVRTTIAGALKVDGSTAAAGLRRTASVCRGTLVAPRAGIWEIGCRLDAHARAALATHALRIALTTTLTAADESHTQRRSATVVTARGPGGIPVTG